MAEAANGDQDDGDIGIAGDGDEGQESIRTRRLPSWRSPSSLAYSRTSEHTGG